MSEYRFSQAVAVRASPETGWGVLRDVEEWPAWTSSVRSISRLDPGVLQVGSRVRIDQPRLPTMTWTVDRLEPRRSFSWVAQAPGARTTADHRVTPSSDGCDVVLEVRQVGPLAWVAGRAVGAVTRRYLAMEASGLRRRAESVAA